MSIQKVSEALQQVPKFPHSTSVVIIALRHERRQHLVGPAFNRETTSMSVSLARAMRFRELLLSLC